MNRRKVYLTLFSITFLIVTAYLISQSISNKNEAENEIASTNLEADNSEYIMEKDKVDMNNTVTRSEYIALEEGSEPTRVRKNLGKFKRIWNNRPVIGEWLKVGQGLEGYRSFLVDDSISFKVKSRGFPREVPFVDNLNVVRFLGGWKVDGNNAYGSKLGEAVANYDLAYRDSDGTMKYRFGPNVADHNNLIKERLDPYISQGYTNLRIVLDNTPYMFPETAQGGPYGQSAPPKDYDEWATFIKDVCNELIRLYGYDMVNKWSFRLGTEAQSQGRFSGTLEEYLEFYDVTARAVAKVLPGAGFGAYNGAEQWGPPLIAVARYAKENNLRFDWIANSTYVVGSNNDPDARAQELAQNWNSVAAVAKNGDILPREIHEFGWFLVNEHRINSNEPGARGGAGNFHYLVNLLGEGLTKIYQWGPYDTFRSLGTTYTFLNSQGWLWSVFESLVGGDAYELNVIAPAETNTRSQRYKALGVFNIPNGKDTVIVSSYNIDRQNIVTEEITVTIPKGVLRRNYISTPQLKYTILSDQTDVFNTIRQDLYREEPELLAPEFSEIDNMLSSIITMTNNKYRALQYVAQNYDRYEDMMKETLTLKEYNGTIEDKEEYYQLKIKLTSPSVIVITLE
jgi:hypothetical protein